MPPFGRWKKIGDHGTLHVEDVLGKRKRLENDGACPFGYVEPAGEFVSTFKIVTS